MNIKVKPRRRRRSNLDKWMGRVFWALLLTLTGLSHYALTVAYSRGCFHAFWEFVGAR